MTSLVLRKIKKNAPEVPVIIFTGYASKEVVLESLRNSADNLIEKPFDIEKSRDVIETLLAKIKKEPEDESLDTKGKINKAKKFLEKYCYSSYLDHTGVEREEGVILSTSEFPAYFSTTRDFREETKEWLKYKDALNT